MGIGFKIPIGGNVPSGGTLATVADRLKVIGFSDLGIDYTNTLDQLVDILLGFDEEPFVTYIWLDNQSTTRLWNDVKAKTGITSLSGSTYLSYGNLTCRVCNGVIKFRFESLSGDIAEFFYTKNNSIGMSDSRLLLSSNDDTKNNTISFASEDTLIPEDWKDIEVLKSNETHASILNKISIMFSNIRWLKEHMGSFIQDQGGDLTASDITEALNEKWDGSTSEDTTALTKDEIEDATEEEWDGSTSDDITALNRSDIEDATS